jgi:biopolymer transport protein ExbD
MAASSSDNDSEISGINVTPLVDIMLVLVIILMVTAEFTRYKVVPVQLPKVNAAVSKREPQKLNLTIKKDKSVWWDDQLVTDKAGFQDRMKSLKLSKPDIAVIIRAEGNTSYNDILEVLDQVKTAGISRVGLATDVGSKNRSK